MLNGLPARVLRMLLIRRAAIGRAHPRLRRVRALLRTAGPAVMVAAALTIASPFTHGTAAQHQLNEAVRVWGEFGNQLAGFDFTAARQNLFSLAYDMRQEVRVVDHDTLYRTRLIGLSNFISRGQIRTVADALVWFTIPLTTSQARAIGLCRPLDEFSRGEEIVIQPDPWQRGIASWYGPGFHGRVAASGEIYNMYDRTAAHKSLPLQSLVRVVSKKTGQSTIVRINDRGPYVAGRIIDLSHRAKELLGMQGGLASVYLERLDFNLADVQCE